MMENTINLKDLPSFFVPPSWPFSPPGSLAISLVSRKMATMDRRNLAHGNTVMHLSATFPFWNRRPATTSISEVPVLVDLRVTRSCFSNQSSEIMRGSEDFIFASTLGNILLPQARRREVSYMLSHIQHSDPRDNDFWINQICSFASQAATEAVQNHGLVLIADIIIEYTEFHAFFEGVQEVNEPLTLGEMFDGKEWLGSTTEGKSSGREIERAIYTTDGFQESECVICLEKFGWKLPECHALISLTSIVLLAGWSGVLSVLFVVLKCLLETRRENETYVSALLLHLPSVLSWF